MDDKPTLGEALSTHAIPPRFDPHYGLAISPDTEEIWEEIKRLDLTYHVAELEVRGYTVVPPDKVASPKFIAQLRKTILDVSERRHGVRPDEQEGATHKGSANPFGQLMAYMLLEDPIFQEAMLNPVGLALTAYMLGKNAIASNCIALIKGPGGVDLHLHADHVLMTSPFPHHPQVCNVTFALSDYNAENGALCFVPGSHKQYRAPMPMEALDQRVAVVAPAGSLIFWGGSTWHGAFARRAPGLRINLLMAMMRPNMRPQEAYRENVTQEVLDRHPPRFATLMGKHLNYGWKEEGPQNEANAYNVSRHAYD
jgi:ectoine hydroxylase-related dioxygenase (phytanoyl-CoA dioxygenase family)